MNTIADVVAEAREKAYPKPDPAVVVENKETAADKPEDKGAVVPVFKAVKVDDQGVITLCASSIAKDSEGDTVAKGAMIGLAFDFCASKDRVFHANHDKAAKIDAQLVESCVGVPVLKSGKILEPGEEMTDADPFDHVRTMDASKAYNTHWFVSVRPTDPAIVKAAADGEIVGSSWGGMAVKAEDEAA